LVRRPGGLKEAVDAISKHIAILPGLHAMTARMSIETVTFHNRFRLPGMDHDHPPGVFEVQIMEEPLNLMWEAYHRTMTLMLTSGGLVEAINVTAEDLETALKEDSYQN